MFESAVFVVHFVLAYVFHVLPLYFLLMLAVEVELGFLVLG